MRSCVLSVLLEQVGGLVVQERRLVVAGRSLFVPNGGTFEREFRLAALHRLLS
jgi:hypothetical protein